MMLEINDQENELKKKINKKSNLKSLKVNSVSCLD